MRKNTRAASYVYQHEMNPWIGCGGRVQPWARWVGCLTLIWAFALVQCADYYRWRGPDLNGISPETGWLANWPAGGPKQLWTANVGIGFASMAVAAGRVYTLGNRDDRDTVYCLDAATGKELWTHSYDAKLEAKFYEGGPSATPTVDGTRVYTLSKRGQLFCLNAATGTVIWSKDLPAEYAAKIPTWGFAGSVLIQGDALYVNVGRHGLALEKLNGNLLWFSGTDAAGYSTPVPYTVGGQEALAFFGANAVYGVDPKSGRALWSYPWKTGYDVNAADPIVQADQIFISSGYGKGCALLRVVDNTPTVLWQNKEMRNHYNSCVLLEGYIYGFDQDGDFKCLDWKTGNAQWTEANFANNSQGALMAADSKLIALSDRGELAILAAGPTGFKPIARAQVLGGKCWTTPVLSHGRIYCRNAAGALVCLDVRP